MTNQLRLQQLRAAINAALADPTDDEAQRTAGRLACVVGLLVLPDRDDRRVLLLDVLGEAASKASRRKPRSRAAKATGRGRKG